LTPFWRLERGPSARRAQGPKRYKDGSALLQLLQQQAPTDDPLKMVYHASTRRSRDYFSRGQRAFTISSGKRFQLSHTLL